MRAIRVGFSRPAGFNLISYLMRLYMRSEFSHSYLVFHFNTLERQVVYEASHGDVHFMAYSTWSKKNQTIYAKTIVVTDEQYKAIMQYCIDHSNKPYSFLTVMLLALGIKWNIDKDRAFICSELVAKALGLKVKDYFTPKDLYERLKSF